MKPADFDENAPAELIMNFSETDTIPPEKSLSKMFRHFGPIQESQTEVDKEKNRARVVFKKGADAEVAYSSAGRFNIFGTKAVKYELSHTITETFKVQPFVVSLGQEDAVLCPSS
ncbi:PWWP domain-containing protein 5 [Cardamine amara subsp. amara]|uniref:PWWP domain-containing protein 5 n=1 Tax=Cardamine amara subsp. amara TaxID=228776 RepID=A0ABD1B2A5_CARAN